MSKVKLVLLAAVVVLIIGLLAWPIKDVCPKGPCTTGPDSNGYVSRYYEVKPIGAALIETITGKNLPLRYTSGSEKNAH